MYEAKAQLYLSGQGAFDIPHDVA